MKDEAAFLSDLGKSRRAVNDFASMLAVRGVRCWMPPERTRPDASDRMAYADGGDLMIEARVEHKVRGNIRFTSRDDYPYQTVIVDEAYKVDAKDGEPVLAYVIESSDREHAAVVYGWTKKHWGVESRFDANQGRKCDFYVCDKRYVRFCQTNEVF